MRFLLRYKKKVFITIIILLLTVFAFYYIYNNSVNHDALMIKEKYESLNGEYQTIKIDSNAKIKNISENDAVNTIKNSSGVIFIGYNKCAECRKTLDILLEVLDDNDMELLYLDGENLRDEFIVKSGKLKKIMSASKSYYKLLDLLDNHLDNYIIEDETGKQFDTKEKRIEFPAVIFVSNGNIVGVYTSSVKEDDKKLYNKFEKNLEQMDGELCSKETNC